MNAGTLIPTWGSGHMLWGAGNYLADEDGFILVTRGGEDRLETESGDHLDDGAGAELNL